MHFRNICFDDWGTLDKNNDGEPDFICEPYFNSYKELLEELYVGGLVRKCNLELYVSVVFNSGNYKEGCSDSPAHDGVACTAQKIDL